VHPSFVAIAAANPQPLPFGCPHFGAVTVEDLGFLNARCPRIVENGGDRRANADNSWTQSSGQSMSGISHAEGGASGSRALSVHLRHFTIPRKLHITQMKVPQVAQG
jgi:hypothetical protein